MRVAALLLAVALAACDSPPRLASRQPPASNTSFLAIVSSGTSHKLYVPARASPTNLRAQLAVVDAAAPHGSSGLIRFLDLGADGVPQVLGASGQDLVVVDASQPVVYLADARTDTARGSFTLPAAAAPILASDNQAYSMGVAVDAALHRAWISVSYGLVEYDIQSRTLLDTFTIPVPENFAYDPAARRIYAPFYLCDPVASAGAGTCVPYASPNGPPVTDGLTIVDLSATPGTAYTLEDPVAADPQAPLGRVPDAVAVDFSLGVAMVAIGQPASLQVLDLRAASFDGATLTCAVPGLLAAVTLPSPVYTAVTADPTTHIAMVAEEYGAGVVFIDLARARTGTPSRLDAAMPLLPGGAPWVTRGDPHGALVGVVAGRPYAFLASRERDWIARIDLLGVAGVMAGTGTFEAQVSYISVPRPP